MHDMTSDALALLGLDYIPLRVEPAARHRAIMVGRWKCRAKSHPSAVQIQVKSATHFWLGLSAANWRSSTLSAMTDRSPDPWAAYDDVVAPIIPVPASGVPLQL